MSTEAGGTPGGGAGLDGLARALDHRFIRPELLADAVSHPSLAGLKRRSGIGAAYERLEFLGDRVLGLVVAEWLLERFPQEAEGDLARRHAALVERTALGQVAETLGLGAYLRLSPGEDDAGGRQNRAILADACEATIGALYLDGGLETARAFIRRAWTDLIERSKRPPKDVKTALQEWAQARGLPLPVYEIVERSGPAHQPVFGVQVSVAGSGGAIGRGRSKQIAEKEAARALLEQVGVLIDG